MTTDERQYETELLYLVGKGDQEAFATLYSHLSGRIFALILQVLVDRAQSEEVLQEVFLEVWRTAPNFDPSHGSARGWIVTMARRRAIDRVRSSQRARIRETNYVDYLPDLDTTVSAVEDKIVAQDVRQALDIVGEPWKSTIILSYFSGYSYSQIAAHFQVPVGTVKSRMSQGMKKLRSVLEAGHDVA